MTSIMNGDMALRISIIVPVYNVEDYIKDCFLSIVGQTYIGPIECLFVDDFGTDNSIGILEELISGYDGPIDMKLLHHNENKGLSAARNTGIDNSKGDYVFFLDSDDQIYPETISSLTKAALVEDLPDMVLGSYKVSISDHPINRYRYNYQVLNGQPMIAKAFLSDKLFCMAHNKLVNKNFIVDKELYFKEGIVHEDNLWSFQSFHIAQKVVTVPEISYFYFIRDSSIMTSKNRKRQLMSVKVISDEMAKDVQQGRYELIDGESWGYIQGLLKEKCGGLLNQVYMSGLTRAERLTRLKAIPDDLKALMATHLFSSSPFMRVMKALFKCRCYGLFDHVMNRMYSKNA